MNTSRRAAARLRDRSGSALMAVMWGVVIALILGVTVLQFGVQDATLTVGEAERMKAFYLAEGGLSRAESWLEAQSPPPNDAVTFHPFGELPETFGEGDYSVAITPDPMNGSLTRSIYTVLSTGQVGRFGRTLEVEVGNGTFANFLYFTNREHMPGGGPRPWFTSSDIVDGPVFSNDQIGIRGDPVFLGRVMSAYGGPDDQTQSHTPSFEYYNGDPHQHVESAAASNPPHDYPTFHEGYDLGLNELELPSTQVLHGLKSLAQDGGIALNGNYDIFLSRLDGEGNPMYGYVSYQSPNGDWVDVDLDTFNGVIYVNGSYSISGTLDGTLTVATNGQAYITDDLLYRNSDANGPLFGCEDLLGLISGSDITVANNIPNQDNCVIHAAMIALSNGLRVENWSTGSPRGTLTVHGSIVQDHRGPVGSGVVNDEGFYEVHTGYDKDYHFDERLLNIAPPSFFDFFVLGEYERLSWREVMDG